MRSDSGLSALWRSRRPQEGQRILDDGARDRLHGFRFSGFGSTELQPLDGLQRDQYRGRHHLFVHGPLEHTADALDPLIDDAAGQRWLAAVLGMVVTVD